MRILRAFLGGTFAYAGVQKLSDPGYLSASSPTFIGRQLSGFAKGSPIAWLLHPLMHFPLVVGLVVVVAELAIGLGTLVGIAPFTMAAGGAMTSLLLWLSATWHIHPYFLGSDSIYAVAWVALAVGIWESRSSFKASDPVPVASEPTEGHVGRRAFLRTGVLTAAMLAVGAVAKSFARRPFQEGAVAGPSPVPRSSNSAPAQGNQIASLNDLSLGKPLGFTSAGGEPGVLFRLNDTEVVAYSRVCTHAGCIVDYDASSKLLYCPCHGAEFDPANGARVIGGPAPLPLPRIDVEVDGAGRVIMPSGA
jgi:thiosulfate dehydrogenase [quinone] large subunit